MLSTPTALSPTSSAVTSTCNPAGRLRADTSAGDDGNTAGQACVRARVASDFNPVSILCEYRVSCAETLGVDRASRQVGGVNWRAISARLE